MKTCSKCKAEKPESEFSKHSQKKDGLNSWCRSCKGQIDRAYASANPRAEKIKAWRSVNKERCYEYRKKWAAENPEKAKHSVYKWQKNNPDACRRIVQNRRARERANGGVLSPGLVERLFKLQKGKCACCGLPLGTNYHMDHIMPIALGGPNTDDNIQLLRARCNIQKRAKHPVDFMQQRGFLL